MLSALDKKISEILLRSNILSKDKLSEVMDIARKDTQSLIELLLSRSLVEEEVLLGALAKEVKIPPVSFEKITPDEKLLQQFTEDKANYYNALPIAKISNLLTIAVANPYDVVKFDSIRMFANCEIRLVLGLEPRLREAIRKFYNPEDHKMEELLSDVAGGDIELKESEVDEKMDLSKLEGEAGESPVIKFVNIILFKALKEGASDIHFEPYERKVKVRFRMDGSLHEAFSPPKRMHNSMMSRLKIMSALDISERRIPQDGKFQIKYEGRRVDFRVGIVPTIHGERAVLRLLDSSSLNLSLNDLGFEASAYDAFQRAINASYGMVLVTGPTGAGKTTTLYCAIKEVFSPEDNLITVEDPVEYQLPGIIQVPVNVKQGMTFAAALRSILRQDPDIIMIGEMRDKETADIAIKAAITGHLVFSTLHTNDAVTTINRLIDMGVDSFMVSSAVLLITNQRLIRKLCKHCKEPMTLPPERLVAAGFKPEEIEKATLFKPVGCPKCFNGYKGRVGLYEILEIDEEIRRMVIQEVSTLDIKDYAVNQKGMITLRKAGVLHAMRGNTSVEEVLQNT